MLVISAKANTALVTLGTRQVVRVRVYTGGDTILVKMGLHGKVLGSEEVSFWHSVLEGGGQKM